MLTVQVVNPATVVKWTVDRDCAVVGWQQLTGRVDATTVAEYLASGLVSPVDDRPVWTYFSYGPVSFPLSKGDIIYFYNYPSGTTGVSQLYLEDVSPEIQP